MNLQALARALAQRCELAEVDFKAECDPSKAPDLLELVKDIIAMTNSGGGSILFGLNDDGTPSGPDLTALNQLDPADLTNKISRYTDVQFACFSIGSYTHGEDHVTACHIDPVDIPVVFVKPGTYAGDASKQKTAFAAGTLYFRHGTKSEPADSHDLRHAFDRLHERTRRSWLDGIQKVVEAPPGSALTVVAPSAGAASPPAAVRLTSDPTAPTIGVPAIDQTHPFRQKELVREVNAHLDGQRTVTSFDIVCIRRVHGIQKAINFCYNLNYASPQYSPAFAEWIVEGFRKDPEFFEKTRQQYYDIRAAGKRKCMPCLRARQQQHGAVKARPLSSASRGPGSPGFAAYAGALGGITHNK